MLIQQKVSLVKYYVHNPKYWIISQSSRLRVNWLLTIALWAGIILNFLLVYLFLKSRLYFYPIKKFMACKHHILMLYSLLLIWLFWRTFNLLENNLMLDNLLAYLFALSVFGGLWLMSDLPNKLIKYHNKNLKFIYFLLFLMPGILYDLVNSQKVLVYYDKNTFGQLMIALFLLPLAALSIGLIFKKYDEDKVAEKQPFKTNFLP